MAADLRYKIIKHLEAKGNYDPDVDDYLIEDLLTNQKLCRECLKSLEDDGVVQTYEYKAGVTISRINPAVNAYQMFQRNIHQISSKLGISRNDRIKLKLVEDKSLDDFDKDFR